MLDRRDFLSSTAAAVPLLCTVGGKTFDVSTAREVDEADARRPKTPARHKPRRRRSRSSRRPSRRPAARCASTGSRRARSVGHRAEEGGRVDEEPHHRPHEVPRVRLPADERRLRRAARPPADARPHARGRGRRPARRALPQRRHAPEPGGHDAPARRQVQPRVRRLLPGRLHARRRLHRARRGVHLPLGVHARLGRRLALPRPRAEPHAEHDARPVRRRDRAPEGRRAARRRAGPDDALVRAPGHAPAAPLPGRQRPQRRGQHADRRRRASARTSRST